MDWECENHRGFETVIGLNLAIDLSSVFFSQKISRCESPVLGGGQPHRRNTCPGKAAFWVRVGDLFEPKSIIQDDLIFSFLSLVFDMF